MMKISLLWGAMALAFVSTLACAQTVKLNPNTLYQSGTAPATIPTLSQVQAAQATANAAIPQTAIGTTVAPLPLPPSDLPIAGASLGAIKQGAGLSVGGDGTASVLYGTTAATAAAGNDSRIVGAVQSSAIGTTVAPLPVPFSGLPVGTTANTVAAGNGPLVSPVLKVGCGIGDSKVAHWSEFPNAGVGSTANGYINESESWPQQLYHLTGQFYIPLSNQFGLGGDTISASGSHPGILNRLQAILSSGVPSQCQHADFWVLEGITNSITACLNGDNTQCPAGAEASAQQAGQLILNTGAKLIFQGMDPRGDGYGQSTAAAAFLGETYRKQINRANAAWCARQQRCQFINLDSLGGQNVFTGTVTSQSGTTINYTTTGAIPALGALIGWTLYPATTLSAGGSTEIVGSSASALTTVDTSLTLAPGASFIATQNGAPNSTYYWSDHLHPGIGAAEIISNIYATALAGQLQSDGSSCTGLGDTWSATNPTGQIGTNCGMLGTTGTLTADGTGTASGPVPYGWVTFGAHTSTGTDVFSTVSNVAALGGGTAAQLVATRGANSGTSNEKHGWFQSVGSTSNKWVGGDLVHAECMMNLAAGYQNVNTLYLQMAFPATAAAASQTSIDGATPTANVYPFYQTTRAGQFLHYRTPTVEVGGGANVVGSATGTVLTVSGVNDPMGNVVVGQTIYVAGTSTGVTVASLGTSTGGIGTVNLSGALSYPAGTNFVFTGLPTSGSVQLSIILGLNSSPDAVVTGSISTAGIMTVTAVTSGSIYPGEQVTGPSGASLGATYTVSPYLTTSTTGTGATGTYQVTPSPGSAIASQTLDIGNPASATLQIGNCAIYKDPPGTLTMLQGDSLPHFAANDAHPLNKKAA